MGPIRAAATIMPVKRKTTGDLILGLVALPFIAAGFVARLFWHFAAKDVRIIGRVARAIGEEIGNARR